MSGVVNTHHSQAPSVWSNWAPLGELVGMGLSQACSPPPSQKSIITFRKQLGTRASSPLPSSPLNGCHGGCQRRAHPSPVRTHQAVGEQSQVQAAGQRSPSMARE